MLLLKEQARIWDNAQDKAHKELRNKLLAGNACAYPNFEKEFILKSGGRDTTFGAVLTQR
jgi:hypothetical protein